VKLETVKRIIGGGEALMWERKVRDEVTPGRCP